MITERRAGGNERRRAKANMKWNIHGIEQIFSMIVSEMVCSQMTERERKKKGISRDKQKLHHITINLMSVEMLFQRQKKYIDKTPTLNSKCYTN